MKHLYTLTGNLLAETTVACSDLLWGRTHRASTESFQVGGKGINVARMAQRLGTFSSALCFPGGHTGERCLAWLASQAFAVEPFRQAAETRSGFVVRDGSRETTFLGTDRTIEEEPWLEALRFLERTLQEGDMLAICGSLPGWRPALARPMEHLLARIGGKVTVAVDTYGPPLIDLIQKPVDLVKINREELQTIGADGTDDDSVSRALERLRADLHRGRQWVITGGDAPVIAVDVDGKVTRLSPPKVEKVVSPVGCGDVLLAGLLHEWAAKGSRLENALSKALPLAAANAASAGIADFEIDT